MHIDNLIGAIQMTSIQSVLTALLWASQDLRLEALGTCYSAGIPPLLLADLSELPGLMGQAEYVYKTRWYEFLKEGSIGLLLKEMNLLADSDWH